MQIIQYKGKGSNYWIPLNLSKVLFIVLHHAEAKTATPTNIDDWHLANGWNGGAGYNEYITKDGTVYLMRGDNIGAQCQNMNSKSYGICVEGDYDFEKEMPQAQFNALVERLKYNKSRFKNLVEIAPHSKYVATACPGQYFPLQKVLNAVSNFINKNEEITQIVNAIPSTVLSDKPKWIKKASDDMDIYWLLKKFKGALK